MPVNDRYSDHVNFKAMIFSMSDVVEENLLKEIESSEAYGVCMDEWTCTAQKK